LRSLIEVHLHLHLHLPIPNVVGWVFTRGPLSPGVTGAFRLATPSGTVFHLGSDGGTWAMACRSGIGRWWYVAVSPPHPTATRLLPPSRLHFPQRIPSAGHRCGSDQPADRHHWWRGMGGCVQRGRLLRSISGVRRPPHPHDRRFPVRAQRPRWCVNQQGFLWSGCFAAACAPHSLPSFECAGNLSPPRPVPPSLRSSIPVPGSSGGHRGEVRGGGGGVVIRVWASPSYVHDHVLSLCCRPPPSAM
jgi:hypothetical protein